MKNSVLAVLSQALLVSASYNYNADTDQVRFWMNDGGDDFEMAEMPSLSGRGFASLDIRDCFKKDDSIEDRYDIAILGAPHDAVCFQVDVPSRIHCRYKIPDNTRRPLADLVRDSAPLASEPAAMPKRMATISSRVRIHVLHTCARKLTFFFLPERNALHDWAKIVDCGDAQLTWLDNRAAIKSLDKAHRVISGRPAASADKSTVPRIVTLGGDHTTTLSALRSTHKHWGPVSVIHFDSHIGTSISHISLLLTNTLQIHGIQQFLVRKILYRNTLMNIHTYSVRRWNFRLCVRLTTLATKLLLTITGPSTTAHSFTSPTKR